MEKKHKILIVEDEPELAEMFSLGLRDAGFEVLVLNDGLGVAVKIKEAKPDLVLLDLVMPNMNGYEVLKETKDKTNCAIYVWSNLTQSREIKEAKKLGADGYLIKSDFTPKGLVEKVKEILNHKQ
ncbi:MAG: response regulator [Patescibacteria group bacterium]